MAKILKEYGARCREAGILLRRVHAGGNWEGVRAKGAEQPARTWGPQEAAVVLVLASSAGGLLRAPDGVGSRTARLRRVPGIRVISDASTARFPS